MVVRPLIAGKGRISGLSNTADGHRCLMSNQPPKFLEFSSPPVFSIDVSLIPVATLFLVFSSRKLSSQKSQQNW